MPKKVWSEEDRKAFGNKMRKLREEKQAGALEDGAAAESPTPSDDPTPTEPQIAPEVSVSELTQQVQELKEQLQRIAQQQTPSPAYAPATPQVDPRGRLTGTFEKYIVDPRNYANPTERLAKEPKLQRFAFGINYELGWQISRTQYETKDGVNVVEPKFTVELIKVMLDEETGEPTTGRYVLRSMVLHEDPQAALTVAFDHQLDPESFGGERQFLDEMRYLRIRDWLLEAFYPPKNTGKKDYKEAVIGNRVVKVYEVSSLEPTKIKFD